MTQRILGIVYTHENNALLCTARDYNVAFQAMGFETAVADVSSAEGVRMLADALKSGEVAFCFGQQGVGSNLTRNNVNLWQDARTPFIGLHYDNPCYNIHNHGNASRWVANIYFAETFLDIQRRYIGGDQINTSLPFRMTAPIEPGTIPFAERPIKYLFLKSGEPLDEYTTYFDGLPPNMREGVYQIIRQAEADSNLVLCDLAKALLINCGYDPVAYRTQFWAVVQSLDYYMRRKRAIDIVNWLKLQEGAVIVGNGWNFIDHTGAKADLRPALPLEDAIHLYDQAQFVFNTNPYGADVIHERVISGLMRHCCVISDTNRWWDINFGDVPALLRLNMNNPLDEQIRPFVANGAAARAATGREPALRHFAPADNYAHIVACAEEVRRYANNPALASARS